MISNIVVVGNGGYFSCDGMQESYAYSASSSAAMLSCAEYGRSSGFLMSS